MESRLMTPSGPPLSRRALLTSGLAAAGALLLPRPAAARANRAKVRDIFKGRQGTTIWLDLETAPFPHGRAPWQDPTVIVFVPHHYRVREDFRVDTIVHFHGYRDTAENAMKRHQLREQLADSKQNAIIVFPQGPVRAENPSFGKLDEARGLLRFLTELRRTLQTPHLQSQLGPAGIPNRARIGKLILSAHSGGFRVVARCIEHGGYDISEIYLFDALYGQVPTFRDWLAETYRSKVPWMERRKLVSYYADGDSTGPENLRLMRELDRVGIEYIHEQKEGTMTRREMTRSRAVFVRTRANHQGVLYRTSALRDCLFASGLQRFVRSDWFDSAGEPRAITPRD